MSCACPASSCTFAVSASLRCSVGARRIHSRSGSTPISSEFPCISMNLIRRARYSSGIQSSVSILPPDWTCSSSACSVWALSTASPTDRSVGYQPTMATRRHELTREAARLFAEKGYHGTSIVDLAQAMGVQKASLYHHIESKQDLLWEIAREGAEAFHAALDAIPETLPAVEKLHLALRAHLRVVAEQIDVATVFIREWRERGAEGRVRVLARVG